MCGGTDSMQSMPTENALEKAIKSGGFLAASNCMLIPSAITPCFKVTMTSSLF